MSGPVSWQAPLVDQPSWLDLIVDATPRLLSRREAQWIAEQASGGDLDGAPTKVAMAHFESMVARRALGEPLQYVLGSWGFRELDLWVDGRVLIPRPETEHLVEHALGAARALLADRRRVVIADLGTGSGAIALSLAHELPLGRADIWATDVSEDALAVARANLAGVGRTAAAVRLAQGEWFDALPSELRGRARPDRVEPAVCRLDRCASRRGRSVGARRRALCRAHRSRRDRAHRRARRPRGSRRTASS